MQRFEGKVALITGAASGIGRATAERIASEGGSVFCLDVQAEGLEETAKIAEQAGGKAATRVCDVGQEAEVQASIAACVEHFGRLDLLCNVAGVLRFSHSHEVDTETWQRIQRINVDGTFFAIRAALPHLLEVGGNVVNVSSVAAKAGLPYGLAYAASKGAVLSMTKTLAVEYGGQGLRFNSICPGSIKTPMTAGGAGLPKDADMKLVMRQMPLDQPRGPEACAALIAFLGSEDAAHINGEDVLIDGGALA